MALDSDLPQLRAENERLGAENAKLRAQLAAIETVSPLGTGALAVDGATWSCWLLEATREALLVVDASGLIVRVNRRCCELLALNDTELLGHSAVEVIPPPDGLQGNCRSFEQQVGAARSSYEVALRRRDETSLRLQVASTPWFDSDGRHLGTVILLSDLTEISETRQALRVERELNEKFITLNPHSISIYDAEGRLARANRAYFDLFLSAPPATYSILDDPLVHAAGYGGALRALCGGQAQTFPEIWYNTHDIDSRFPDNPICVEATAFPILDEHGQVRNFVIMHRDITHQKRAEEAAARKQRLLGHLLNVYERDRRMVVFDIHDGLAQQIHSARLQLETYADLRIRAAADAEPMLEATLSLLSRASEEVRRLIVGLRPPVLEQQGVVAALHDLICEQAEQGGPVIEFRHGTRFSRLAPPLESAIYRIVQEA